MSTYFRFTINCENKDGKALVNCEKFKGVDYDLVPLYTAASLKAAQSFINRFVLIHKVDKYFVDINVTKPEGRV